jgi:hypothetical protein
VGRTRSTIQPQHRKAVADMGRSYSKVFKAPISPLVFFFRGRPAALGLRVFALRQQTASACNARCWSSVCVDAGRCTLPNSSIMINSFRPNHSRIECKSTCNRHSSSSQRCKLGMFIEEGRVRTAERSINALTVNAYCPVHRRRTDDSRHDFSCTT